MRRTNSNPVYVVPVLVQSAKDSKVFETVHVSVMNFPAQTKQTQGSVKIPKCVVMVDGTTMYCLASSLGQGLYNLVIYSSHLRLSHDRRELIDNGRDQSGFNTYEFKMSSSITEKVLKAVHLFGFLSVAQYRAAVSERYRLASVEYSKQQELDAEEELLQLVGGPDMPLAKAKKLIDGLVKEQKARSLQAAQDAALLNAADVKDDALFAPGAGL